MTALPAPRLVRLATWLGQRWCGLTTGHTYIRQPDPWRLVLVCWSCGDESPGWDFVAAAEEGVHVAPVASPAARRRVRP